MRSRFERKRDGRISQIRRGKNAMLKDKHTEEHQKILLEILSDRVCDVISDFHSSHFKKYPKIHEAYRTQIVLDALTSNIINICFVVAKDKDCFSDMLITMAENLDMNRKRYLESYDELKAEN